jgi:hypothetical protein
VWVDDAIIASTSPHIAEQVIQDIKKLGMDLDKQGTGGIAKYLGIKVHQMPNGDMHLTQTGLIERIIEVLSIKDANPKQTPVIAAMGACKEDTNFDNQFNYRSVVGMLLYLANTTRPDLSFAVNQCGRFSHDLKETHATALKRIGCYLLQTHDKGLIVKKSKETPTLDCWADTDFDSLFNKEHHQDPASARS